VCVTVACKTGRGQFFPARRADLEIGFQHLVVLVDGGFGQTVGGI
jgi:hypothetical protein